MTNNKHIMKSISIYIHIPFCVKKCHYCDFLSAPAKRSVQEEYLRALKQEIRGSAANYTAYRVESIFVGGGTPTVLETKALCGILEVLKEEFTVAAEAEITVEANPGTVEAEELAALYKAGVNRLSIGLQSALPGELALLGRIHSYEDFEKTYAAAVRAGFSNINVDLMMALPGQQIQDYAYTLDKVLSLKPQPTHISAYSLIIEEGTPFYECYGEQRDELLRTGECSHAAKGTVFFLQNERQKWLPSEEEEREMDALTGRKLAAAGYVRYEISNYCKDGYTCRHNRVYWQRGNYAGFGLGAASMVENVRFRNESVLQEYLKNPLRREEKAALGIQDQMEEFMFLGLRLTEGVDKAQFQKLFGIPMEQVYGSVLEQNERAGLLKQGERVSLTEKGRDVSNYVMAQFLLED